MNRRRTLSADCLVPEASALLELLGPPELQPAGLDAECWQKLDAIAAEHRLRPHLHGRRQRGEIVTRVPAGVAHEWQEAHRISALTMLAQQRVLRRLAMLLEEAKIAVVALKGAWLAWHAYPAAAERPMRDIDLLVAQSDAPQALELLLAQGFELASQLAGDAAGHAARFKQFPPLVGPEGAIVELHAHAWEPPGSMEWLTPPLDDAGLLARSIAEPGERSRSLCPADMLAQLCIHAAYSHRFEVGPLLLADIDYLLRARKFDWPGFWRAAGDGGFQRGAALALALVDRWRRPGLMAGTLCPVVAGPDAVAHASALLVQPLGQRKGTRLLSALQDARAAGGPGRVVATAFARIGRLALDPAGLAKRIGETASDLRNPAVTASARHSAAIGQWLEDQ